MDYANDQAFVDASEWAPNPERMPKCEPVSLAVRWFHVTEMCHRCRMKAVEIF